MIGQKWFDLAYQQGVIHSPIPGTFTRSGVDFATSCLIPSRLFTYLRHLPTKLASEPLYSLCKRGITQSWLIDRSNLFSPLFFCAFFMFLATNFATFRFLNSTNFDYVRLILSQFLFLFDINYDLLLEPTGLRSWSVRTVLNVCILHLNFITFRSISFIIIITFLGI